MAVLDPASGRQQRSKTALWPYKRVVGLAVRLVNRSNRTPTTRSKLLFAVVAPRLPACSPMWVPESPDRLVKLKRGVCSYPIAEAPPIVEDTTFAAGASSTNGVEKLSTYGSSGGAPIATSLMCSILNGLFKISSVKAAYWPPFDASSKYWPGRATNIS